MYSYLAELIGTAIFIFLGMSVNAANYLRGSYNHQAGVLSVVLGWGCAYSLSALCFFNISGAYFNPVIPLSLASIGLFDWALVPGYLLAELAGAFIGALGMFLFYKDQFDDTDSPEVILNVFTSDAAIANLGLNLWAEIVVSFLFVFFFAFVLYQFPDRAYLGYGFITVTLALCLGGTTRFAINPAADLMGRLAHQILPIPNKKSSNWGYVLVPLVGPFIGGLMGAQLVNFIARFPAPLN